MRYALLPNPTPWGVNEKRHIALSKLYSSLKGSLKRKYDLKVDNGAIFNSGYEGLSFTVNGVKFIIFDQPGVVGLEDQRPGYISISGNKEQYQLGSHKHGRFGDVEMTDEERSEAYSKILELIPKMLRK